MREKEIRKLVQKKFSGKVRKDNLPAYIHAFNVASILKSIVEQADEIKDKDLISDMTLAAYGHDLIEDTDTTSADLERYGERAVRFIEFLTNKQDDYHIDEYMEQLKTAPEEVLIVKYCDLIDNVTSVAYELSLLGENWVREFFLPISQQTTETLQKSIKVNKYPETFKLARQIIKIETELLLANLENYKS